VIRLGEFSPIERLFFGRIFANWAVAFYGKVFVTTKVAKLLAAFWQAKFMYKF
jgi:hypothetical protein